MVGTPISWRVTSHCRTASFRALRAIACISPVCPEERRAERNRLRRDRRRRADAAFYRGLLEYCGVPAQPRRRRQPAPPREEVNPVIVVSSDTSAKDLPPPPQQQEEVQLDFDSLIDELPNIDPRPQHQLPVRQQVMQRAYVLMEWLQLPMAHL